MSDKRDYFGPIGQTTQPDLAAYPGEGMVLGGRYRLEQIVGRGGMGVVYRARDERTDEVVAVKALAPELKGDEVAMACLQREAHQSRRLKHSNIVGVYNFEPDLEYPFLVMEWLRGKSLASLLVEKTNSGQEGFSFEELACWLPAVGEALDYAHKHGVIHRDVKPANIFIDQTSQPLLVDFGIAYEARDSRIRLSGRSDSVPGSPAYSPPEAWRGGHSPDARDDVYGLAVTIYELLTGGLPFRGDLMHSRSEVMKPGRPAGLEEHHWQVLVAALSVNREERPASAGEFVNRLLGQRAEGQNGGRMTGRPHRGAAIILTLVLTGPLAWWFFWPSTSEDDGAPPEAGQIATALEGPAANCRTGFPDELMEACLAEMAKATAIWQESDGWLNDNQIAKLERLYEAGNLTAGFLLEYFFSHFRRAETRQAERWAERNEANQVFAFLLELAERTQQPEAAWLVGGALDSGHVVAEDLEAAVRWYRVAAEQEFSPAQVSLGHMYERGDGVARNHEEAARWYRMASEQQHSSGLHNLAAKYFLGEGVPQDQAAAVRLLKDAAQNGSAPSMAALGWHYLEGVSVEQDNEEAAKWYRSAAELGYPDGMFGLAGMYLDGLGVNQSNTEALRWYHAAALKGHLTAKVNVGVAYRDGMGVEQDYKRATEWFNNAAEQGYPLGMAALAQMHLDGKGVDQSNSTALRWNREAAELGSPEAQMNLAFMYSSGRGVRQNEIAAANLYRAAAEQGIAEAQVAIGWRYRFGVGVTGDHEQATKWFQAAADQGDPEGMVQLAQMYLDGLGVEQSYTAALRWYREAADFEYPAAKVELGWLYRAGRGMDQDYEGAVEWFQKAANQGDHDGLFALAQMYYEGLGVQQDYQRSVQLLLPAAEDGYSFAQWALGIHYLEGRGVQQDEAQAAKWFQMAADQGNEEARRTLEALKQSTQSSR